jgi:rare lipoprotein A
VRRTDVDRSVVVRINDRGPFVESRIIDLSQAAARVLGMVQPGVVPVSLEVVDAAEAPMPTAQTPFAVQVGAYRLRDNAFRARQAMEHAFGKATVVHRQRDDMWCVLVGDPATRAEADSLAETVRKQGGTAAFVVRASDSPAPSTE